MKGLIKLIWNKIKKSISIFDTACVFLLIGLVFVLCKIQGQDNYQIVGIAMSIASLLAALIVGKVVAKNEHEAKVKEISITAYRHNRKSLHQLDLIIDNIEFNLKKHSCNNTGSVCNYFGQLERIHDLLNNIRFDIDENKKDWESFSPEEMDNVKDIRALQEDLNKELSMQGEEKDEQRNDQRISDIQKNIANKKKALDSKYYIILNDEKEFQDKLLGNRMFQEEIRDANMYKVQKKYNGALNKVLGKYYENNKQINNVDINNV